MNFLTMALCHENLELYGNIQTTLAPCFTEESPEVGTIYNHPTTQYEQFIERYYGRHKGTGKSKATVIRRTSNFA